MSGREFLNLDQNKRKDWINGIKTYNDLKHLRLTGLSYDFMIIKKIPRMEWCYVMSLGDWGRYTVTITTREIRYLCVIEIKLLGSLNCAVRFVADEISK